jgi:uncharacterized repeat protein (TIGR02543 family)
MSSTDNMSFYKSTNSGGTWTTTILSGVSSEGYAVAVDPVNENVIYIGGVVWSPSSKGVVFKSTNGGSSWSEITGTISSGNEISDLAVDPSNANVIYAGAWAGLWRSDNAGGSWTKVSNNSVKTIAINRNASSEIYIGGYQGVFFSTNKGGTWSDYNAGLTDLDVVCLSYDSTNNVIYAGTMGAGVFRNSSLRMLTLTCSAGGTTTPATGTYFHPDGASVQVTAAPNSKFRFSGWSGDATGTANPLAVVMTANKTIAANFERTLATLTITAGEGGTTSPVPGSKDYSVNASIQIQAVPNDGFDFVGWTGDAAGTANPLTVVLSTDKSIGADFRLKAPLEFTGAKLVNRSVLSVEYLNRLTWQGGPDNAAVANYKLYFVASGAWTPLAELPAGTSTYDHRKVDKNKEYEYVLVAVSAAGREGAAASATVR